MTRKEDKLRPYRIDYFNVNEMKDIDLALVRSEVVRAVTSDEAIYELLGKPETWKSDPRPLIVIRAYRYYQKLTSKKDSFTAIEDLFPANKAVEVMEVIENYRKYQTTTNDLGNTPAVQAQMDALVARAEEAGYASEYPPTGHVTRFSDSSLYDEVCTKCGATDASGGLDQPCVVATPSPTSGPDSPATKAAIADLNGMLSHDAHEQAMDTFVPNNVPEGKTLPDPTNTAPVITLTPTTPTPPSLIEPDQAVGEAGRPPVPPPNLSSPNVAFGKSSSTVAGVIIICAVLIVLGFVFVPQSFVIKIGTDIVHWLRSAGIGSVLSLIRRLRQY
jgi:hypothetical protein